MFLAYFLVIVGVTQLICPLCGLLSDRHKSKWGKRRPFILVGLIIGLVGISLLTYGSIYIVWWVFMIGLAVSMLAVNIMMTVQNAIVPDFCSSRIGEASGIVAALTQGGNLFAMLWIIATFTIDPHWCYALYVILFVGAAVVVFFSLSEKPTQNDDVPPVTCSDVGQCYWLGENENDFYWVFIGRTFYYMSVSLQAFLYYYLRDMMGVEDEAGIRWRLAVLVIIAMVSAIVVALPLGRYSESVGRMVVINIACVTMALVYAGYIFCPILGTTYGMYCVYFLAGVYGVGTGAFLSVDYALALDCLPGGNRGPAESLGIWGISGFLGSAVGPMLGGFSLEVFGGWGKGGHYTYPGYICMLACGAVTILLTMLTMRFIKSAR